MTTPPSADASDTVNVGESAVDVVEVRTPADVAYVSTLRLTAASLASRCDLTLDDIEDLRLAVDEACSLLLPHAVGGADGAGATLEARFEVGDGTLTVRATVTTADTAQPDRDGFAWTVLGALVSSIDVDAAPQRLTLAIVKKRADL